MNENLNLVEILKDCPKGWKFWSPLFVEVEFDEISKICNYIYVKANIDGRWYFNADGTITIGGMPSPTIMLYPSKNQRDWSKFTAPWYKKERKEKFDPKSLKPFDKVLVFGEDQWACDFYSHTENDIYGNDMYICTGDSGYVIPYNDDTKHLVGTSDDAPEYYKYWED